LHVRPIGIEHAPIIGLGVIALRQPPNGGDCVLEPPAADVHPFGRTWELGAVIPVELLSKVKGLGELKKQPVLVQRLNGPSWHPASTELQHEASIFPEHTVKLLGEWQEPLDVTILALIAVSLLMDECVRWRGDDQVHAVGRKDLQKLQTVSQ